jgi:hypothetical protein
MSILTMFFRRGASRSCCSLKQQQLKIKLAPMRRDHPTTRQCKPFLYPWLFWQGDFPEHEAEPVKELAATALKTN